MAQHHATVLDDPVVRAAFIRAWRESQPGNTGGHEEGGFILQDSQGKVSVVQWPVGEQNSITLPPHPNCTIGGRDIVATFHTHPNTASHYLQEPSETDKRAVQDDLDLKAEFYEGEFVISQAKIYLIAPNGQVNEVGATDDILSEE